MSSEESNCTASALIGLGSNMPFQGLAGPALLEAALGRIAGAGLRIIAASSAWRSPAWPDPSQPDFTNAAAKLEVGNRSPDALYRLLASVEEAFGRDRRERWGARTLDLDLLDQKGLAGEFNGVIVPHTRLSDRLFELAPLHEIEPGWVHPQSGQSVSQLLQGAQIGGGLQRIGPLRIAPGGAPD